MIATHNIKVNGRWIRAGEEYEPERVATPKRAEKAEPKPVVQEDVPAEKVEEPKPRSTSRRKASK